MNAINSGANRQLVFDDQTSDGDFSAERKEDIDELSDDIGQLPGANVEIDIEYADSER